MPGIGKKNQDLIDAGGWDLLLEHFNCVVADDAQVRQRRLFNSEQQAPDAGPVDFNAKIIAFRMGGCECEQVIAVAEANLDDLWRGAAEGSIKVKRGALKRDTKQRP